MNVEADDNDDDDERVLCICWRWGEAMMTLVYKIDMNVLSPLASWVFSEFQVMCEGVKVSWGVVRAVQLRISLYGSTL